MTTTEPIHDDQAVLEARRGYDEYMQAWEAVSLDPRPDDNFVHRQIRAERDRLWSRVEAAIRDQAIREERVRAEALVKAVGEMVRVAMSLYAADVTGINWAVIDPIVGRARDALTAYEEHSR